MVFVVSGVGARPSAPDVIGGHLDFGVFGIGASLPGVVREHLDVVLVDCGARVVNGLVYVLFLSHREAFPYLLGEWVVGGLCPEPVLPEPRVILQEPFQVIWGVVSEEVFGPLVLTLYVFPQVFRFRGLFHGLLGAFLLLLFPLQPLFAKLRETLLALFGIQFGRPHLVPTPTYFLY